jgi:hypothetical protein
MKKVHLVITDLFLPKEFAAEVCAGLPLPALEKLLARGVVTGQARADDLSLEASVCGLFSASSGVASISAAFDGLPEGVWLRADPVHVRLQREQVVLLPDVAVSADEAMQFCISLNAHFAGQGVTFFAPHPNRWYVRLDEHPDIQTMPLSQAAGRNIHGNLPAGAEARRWHQLFNEIQMLLFAHPLNDVREARGDVPVNSVWFWGNGAQSGPARDDHASSAYDSVSSDEVLVEMLASAADVPFFDWQPAWSCGEGRQLLVWTGLRRALQRGDLAGWRDALQSFETGYAEPLWQALRSGKIEQLQVDVLGGNGLRQASLARFDAWAFWRRNKSLAAYSVESKSN